MGRVKKKMKISITILALFVIGYSTAALGTPAKTAYCMGRKATVHTCSSCFNWGTGTIGAREYLASNHTCLIKVSKPVTDCLIYNGVITATKGFDDCLVCNKKIWLNIVENAGAITSRACSDTAVKATKCTTKIANCGQNMCVNNTASSGKTTPGCRQCMKGYVGATPVTTAKSASPPTIGYTTCTLTGALKNCELSMFNNALHCYTCKSGFAVASAQTSCATFTLDSNCRKLHTGDAACVECWHSYYFNLAKCVLSANIMALGGMVMFVLAFFN